MLPSGMTTPPMNQSASSLLAGCVDDTHHTLSSINQRQPLFQMVSADGLNGHDQSRQSHQVEEVEEILSSEFKKLSVPEQARALDDLNHASGSELKEDPAVIDQLLSDFEDEVGRFHSPIYEQALVQDSSYVEDPAFRLKFLRANLHNVKEATKQMLSFLRHKATYFGSDKITSDITVDDLTPDELKLMLSGIYHIQDGTDRNGRVILTTFAGLVPQKFNAETMVRLLFLQLRLLHVRFSNCAISFLFTLLFRSVSFTSFGSTF